MAHNKPDSKSNNKSDQSKSDQSRTSDQSRSGINKDAVSPKSDAKSDAKKVAPVVPLPEDDIVQPEKGADNKQEHIEEEARKGESMTSDLTRKTQGEGLEG